jgi:hypothetical protein
MPLDDMFAITANELVAIFAAVYTIGDMTKWRLLEALLDFIE